MVQLHTQVVEQDVQLMQMRTELAKSEAESDALHGQLKDFAVSVDIHNIMHDKQDVFIVYYCNLWIVMLAVVSNSMPRCAIKGHL